MSLSASSSSFTSVSPWLWLIIFATAWLIRCWPCSKRRKRNKRKYGKKKRKRGVTRGCLMKTGFRKNKIGAMMISCNCHVRPLSPDGWGKDDTTRYDFLTKYDLASGPSGAAPVSSAWFIWHLNVIPTTNAQLCFSSRSGNADICPTLNQTQCIAVR